VDAETADHVHALAQKPSGGADFHLEALKAIDALGISLPEIGAGVLRKIESAPEPAKSMIELDVESIPVKKTLLDWILFRNQASIRRRILGMTDDLSQPIPEEVKRKRLGSEGLRVIQELCIESLNLHFGRIPAAASERAIGAYAGGFLQELDQRVHAAKLAVDHQLKTLRARLASDALIVKTLDKLSQRANDIDARIAELADSCSANTSTITEPEASAVVDTDTDFNIDDALADPDDETLADTDDDALAIVDDALADADEEALAVVEDDHSDADDPTDEADGLPDDADEKGETAKAPRPVTIGAQALLGRLTP